MSVCDAWMDDLLEAEPAALRGEGDTPLAAHVRSCAGCREAATVLLEETALLDAALGATPPLDVDAVLRRAALDVASGAQPNTPVRTRGRWAAGTAVAAAAVAVLYLGRATPPPAPGGAAVGAAVPILEAAPAQDVAVLATGNPDITVLWFF